MSGPASATPRRVLCDGVAFNVVDSKPTFWDRVAAGQWEPGTRETIARLTGGGCLFLDIGAWVGPTALLAAARGADVVALEPDPAARAELEANVAANPTLAPRIRVLPQALAAVAGTARLSAARKPGDSMSSLVAGGPSGLSWAVETITPEALRDALGTSREMVVKMDIEGAEYDVLPKAAPLLEPSTRAAIVSFHPAVLEAGSERAFQRTAAALEVFDGFDASLLDHPGPMMWPTREELAARLAAGPGTALFERLL